jgi:hypothetical protein
LDTASAFSEEIFMLRWRRYLTIITINGTLFIEEGLSDKEIMSDNRLQIKECTLKEFYDIT